MLKLRLAEAHLLDSNVELRRLQREHEEHPITVKIEAYGAKRGGSGMTKQELIEALASFPDELEVTTEGCDCYGDVAFVNLVQRDNWHPPEAPTVLLCRSDGPEARQRG